tara:strand:+ start:8241 stop:10190 length:1950 start_codon:yes stop_codon:yes gene_type:complete
MSEPIKIRNPQTGEIKYVVKGDDGRTVEVKKSSSENDKYTSGYSQVSAGEKYTARQEANKEADYQRELSLRGPDAQERAEIAKNTSPIKKMGLLAMDELRSLSGGMKELANSDLRDVASLVAGNIMPAIGNLTKRTTEDKQSDTLELQEYQKNRKVEKEQFKEMDESAGLTQIARMAPYLATGAVEAPIAGMYRGGIKALTDITRKGMPQAINATGRPSILPEYMGAMTLGAAEGGLHEDEGADEGLVSSFLGRLGGRTIGKYLEKAPNTNSNFDNDLVERFREKGYNASPGMRTGNKLEQRRDAVQRSDPRYEGWYDERDRTNNAILAKDIKDAAGFKDYGDSIDTINPAVIKDHVKSLKAEYTNLEANTKGVIPSSDFSNIENKIADLDEYDIARIKKDFRRFVGGDMDSDRVFDGKTYQDQLRYLKQGKTRALSESNTRLSDVYDDMMTSLAKGLEGGMQKDQVERWRDLNERWAMTSLIKEKGLDANNKIDTSKLLGDITASDMDRLVTGVGKDKRIGKFHDVVRIKHLENTQEKPGMGEALSDISPRERRAREKAKPGFWSGAERSTTKPMDNFKMNLQYNGLFNQPRKVFGILGNPSEGLLSTGSLTRALEQGTDAKVGAYDYVTEPEERYKEAKNYVTSLLN